MRYPTIDNLNCKYGAPMGRESWTNYEGDKIRVFRVPIDSQGYDVGGAYWGTGQPLYCCTDSASFRVFYRAKTRADAIEKMQREFQYSGFEFTYFKGK